MVDCAFFTDLAKISPSRAEVNSYLVAVTKATLIGQIFGRKVFQVQKLEYFCLASE